MKVRIIFLLIMGCSVFLQAQLELHPVFTDNMVLQKDVPVPIWGKAYPNEAISIFIGKEKYKGIADNEGNWKIVLPAHESGASEDIIIHTLTKGDTLTNVLFGDVWLCGGQSNMEWYVRGVDNADEEIKDANFKNIRIIDVNHKMTNIPMNTFVGTPWQEVTPHTIPEFSAVGYFFGRHLYRHLNIPIGLIGSNFGGTIAEIWTSKEGLYDIPYFRKGLDKLATLDFEKEKEYGDAAFAKWINKYSEDDRGKDGDSFIWADPNIDRSDWQQMELPGLWETSQWPELKKFDGVIWFAKEFSIDNSNNAELYLGAIDDSDRTWVNGILVGETYNQYNKSRIYKVPGNVLKKGKNIVIVRVEDYVGGGGIYGENDIYLKVNGKKVNLSGD